MPILTYVMAAAGRNRSRAYRLRRDRHKSGPSLVGPTRQFKQVDVQGQPEMKARVSSRRPTPNS